MSSKVIQTHEGRDIFHWHLMSALFLRGLASDLLLTGSGRDTSSRKYGWWSSEQRGENKPCRELDFTRRAWQGALMSFQERNRGMAADGRLPGTLMVYSKRPNQSASTRPLLRPPRWDQRGKANVRELQQFTESLLFLFFFFFSDPGQKCTYR